MFIQSRQYKFSDLIHNKRKRKHKRKHYPCFHLDEKNFHRRKIMELHYSVRQRIFYKEINKLRSSPKTYRRKQHHCSDGVYQHTAKCLKMLYKGLFLIVFTAVRHLFLIPLQQLFEHFLSIPVLLFSGFL